MTGTLRTLSLLWFLLAPALARADIYVPPPVEREPVGATLRGQPSSAAGILFTAHNPTAVPVTLVLSTLTEHGRAVSLAQVEANGRAVSGVAITIPPGATVHVVIHVPPPTLADASRRTFILHATLAGRAVTATSTLLQPRPPHPMATS